MPLPTLPFLIGLLVKLIKWGWALFKILSPLVKAAWRNRKNFSWRTLISKHFWVHVFLATCHLMTLAVEGIQALRGLYCRKRYITFHTWKKCCRKTEHEMIEYYEHRNFLVILTAAFWWVVSAFWPYSHCKCAPWARESKHPGWIEVHWRGSTYMTKRRSASSRTNVYRHKPIFGGPTLIIRKATSKAGVVVDVNHGKSRSRRLRLKPLPVAH